MDYIYIRAWGQYNRLPSRFIRDEVQKARDDKAPTNVIFKHEDGTWADITNTGKARQQIEQIAGQIQANQPATRTIL